MRFSLSLLALVSLPVLPVLPGGPVEAAAFPLWPDTQVVGEIRHVKTRGDETLPDLAAQFGVGLDELERLNVGVDPWRPDPGTWITLPTQFVLPDAPRDGVVINVAERRLYYYIRSLLGRGAEVMTFPVVLGDRDWTAMLGPTHIEAKLEDAASPAPAAYGRESEAQVEGDFALRLGIPGCLVAATNAEEAAATHGPSVCIGLQPNDLNLLFEEVREGTPVRIVDQPYKVGWRDGALYLESHASFNGDSARSITPAVRAVIHATAEKKPAIDWDVVRRSAEQASGVPVRISR